MNTRSGKDNNKTNPTTTTSDVSQAELDLRIEQNRLEAQKRRKESQREAASTLQALTLQQQEQVRKLQEHVLYDQLREDTASRTTLPSNRASDNTLNNLKFDGSSVYVATFNPPPPHNMKLPDWGMSHIHVPHKTPRDSSTMTITPNTNNNFANAFELPPVKNVATMPQDTLLPLLGAEPPDLFPHGKSTTPTQPTLTQRSCSDECGSVVAQDSYRATPHSPKVIDLTNESTESSTEPPKKRNKTTTIEVTVIVTMPGLAQPSVKKMQSTVESANSDDDSAK
jgi:uncharacterized small protein (DUF1192 family)